MSLKGNPEKPSPLQEQINGGERKGSTLRLIPAPRISIKDLASQYPNGLAYRRADVTSYITDYDSLLSAPMAGFKVERPGQDAGSIEFAVVGPALTGEQVNKLMYFAASNKSFGLDTYDIISDWNALYNGSSDQAARLRRHARMPGWESFEASKLAVLGVITRNFDAGLGGYRQIDQSDVLIPVVHGIRNAEGNIELSIEPLSEELRTYLTEHTGYDSSRFDGGLGLLLIASVSPDNASWPTSSGYGRAVPEANDSNIMTPTQVLAFAYRRVAEKRANPDLVPDNQDIQRAPILAALADHINNSK